MTLNPGEIHIWSADIDQRYEKLLVHSCLSLSERRRGQKFLYDIDSFLFLIRYNLLRIILGRYLNCHPKDIKFKYNHYQKPQIARPKTSIQFNISISSNRFVAAFCLYNPIGVDIEIYRQIENINQLIADNFTSNEVAIFSTHPESRLNAEFFNVWAKKEAIVKAIGQGLSLKLNTFDVSFNPVTLGGNVWHLTPLTIFNDCVAALAVNSLFPSLSYFNAAELL